jgi:predicted ATPase
MANGFEALELQGWRQFHRIALDLRKQLTILTGANGAGKTTLLTLLTEHFGWAASFVAEPTFIDRGLKFAVGFRKEFEKARHALPPEARQTIGRLIYADGNSTSIDVPDTDSPTFNVNFPTRRPVSGVFVPSHRPTAMYEQVAQIPTSVVTPEAFIEQYENEVRTRHTGQHTAHSATYKLKEALLALATFGYETPVSRGNPEYIATFEGFQGVLKDLLPSSLGFERLVVANPEVIIETGSGSFSFDAVSGGVGTLIDLAWRVYMRARQNPELVVVLDEPENHLHPELQRAVLPGLLTAFPDAQFIVATHNPFIVGSVPDSNVYVLDYNDAGGVESLLLDTVNKAGSSNEILRDALGLEFTLPLWVEEKLEDIIARYASLPADETRLVALRVEMSELGMSHLFPQAVSSVLKNDDQAE